MNFSSSFLRISLLILLGLLALRTQAQPGKYKPVSKGVYRIPYADGTKVKVTGDHINHSTWRNKLDMHGKNGYPYEIVAAADGYIRAIADTHLIKQCPNGPGCFNNYVWIEHPNGEWTNYSHMQPYSVQGRGWEIGDHICAGEVIGLEGDIGVATGDHLHFEVAVPNDPNDPYNGGWLYNDNVQTVYPGNEVVLYNRQSRIPLFCINGVSQPLLSGDVVIAGGCSYSACPTDNTVSGSPGYEDVDSHRADNLLQTSGTYTVQTETGVAFLSGTKIRLKPGFQVNEGGYFVGAISPCGYPSGTIQCFSLKKESPPASFAARNVPVLPHELCTHGHHGCMEADHEEEHHEGEHHHDDHSASTRPGSDLLPGIHIVAHPNPARDKVTFSLDLQQAESISLVLLDQFGREISTLLSQQDLQAGQIQYTYDLSGLSAGLYFYQLSTQTHFGTHKILIAE